MFKGNTQHETGIKRAYIQNVKGKGGYVERIRLKNRGAFLKYGNKHLDRKVRKCYPRGKSFFRMCDMCTSHHLTNT